MKTRFKKTMFLGLNNIYNVLNTTKLPIVNLKIIHRNFFFIFIMHKLQNTQKQYTFNNGY